MLSEWELWACANELVKQHGRSAVLRAGERRLDLETQGDEQGAITWGLILIKIIELLKEPQEGDQRH